MKSPNWFDKNRSKKILAIIDSNKFSHKNKIGEFKYIDIKDLVNNIKNNTISEIDAKKSLNALNKIKNAEIKYKRLITGQKELLKLFNNLSDTILTDKTLMPSKDENERENEKLKQENENENEDENEDGDDIIKILIHWKEYDEETITQNKKKKIIKKVNDHLDEIIDKSKSFGDQIKSIKKVKNLDDYYYVNDFGDKELKFKIFKLKLAHLSNEIDENLFEQIFGHTLETLANKLINTTNKEENQIIVKNIDKNKDNFFKKMHFIILWSNPNNVLI